MDDYLYRQYKKFKYKHGVDPSEIISSIKSIRFREGNLGKIFGVYSFKSERNQAIAINENLNDYNKIYTMFHEISHYILKHRGMRANLGNINVRKDERNADILATYFFMDYYGLDLKKPETFEGIVLPEKIRFYILHIQTNLKY